MTTPQPTTRPNRFQPYALGLFRVVVGLLSASRGGLVLRPSRP